MVVDFNKAAKAKQVQEPSCRYCQSNEYSYSSMPDGTHLAMPVYHVKGKPGAHVGLIARACKRCGHSEFFAENTFREFLGVDPFVHEAKKDK